MTIIKPLTQDWHEARKGRITASRVSMILGTSSYGNRDDVMREMVREHFNAESEFVETYDVLRGRENEVNAIEGFTSGTGKRVTEGHLVTHPKYDFLAATPDGFIEDESAIIECKCPRQMRELQDMYRDQMQLQMACTGATHCYFIQWVFGQPVDVIKVKHDPAWIGLNYIHLYNFIEEYKEIINDEALYKPYLEPKVKHMESNEWLDTTKELKDINFKIKQLQAVEKELKADLISLADNKKCEGNGVLVYPTKRKNVDYKKLIIDANIDVNKYENVKESWCVKIAQPG